MNTSVSSAITDTPAEQFDAICFFMGGRYVFSVNHNSMAYLNWCFVTASNKFVILSVTMVEQQVCYIECNHGGRSCFQTAHCK